jgi:UDP-N-acetylmuramoyl-L-alanyl-D-glutamate--2,6-diaminopimelate ligase
VSAALVCSSRIVMLLPRAVMENSITRTPPYVIILAMRLGDLVQDVPGAALVQGDPEADVRGVVHDSRRVQPGQLFVVLPGATHDARAYVPQALARGAAGVVADTVLELPPGRALIQVPAARPALADVAAALQGHPSRALRLVGVTGTDGKTSTTRLLAAILVRAGQRVGWLTTVDVRSGGEIRANDLHHTTPEADRVQEVLAEMAAAHDETAIVEVSSHALALDRVRACEFDLAIFTNLSPEHLNFHGTMDEYARTKARLFAQLSEPSGKAWPRVGILNADDPASAVMRERCAVPVRWYGIDQPADVAAHDIRLDVSGVQFRLVTPQGQAIVASRLLGRFNVANWLAATAAALELGATLDDVVQAAAATAPVPGRMDQVDQGQPFLVVVDFAHTPQALENALRTVRAHTTGKVMVVFGHAGERDPANRPTMGRIAAEQSDFFVISMDDPLNEDPAEIAAQIAAGAVAAGKTEGRDFAIDLDRAAAIRTLVQRAQPGDTVLLAGKGHERRMLVRDERRPWNDRDAAAEALRDAGYGVPV